MVLLADPLGPSKSMLGPAIFVRQPLSSLVIKCRCHCLWCAAGGLSATYSQKKPKSSRAFFNSASFVPRRGPWFLAAARAFRL